jgi:hypothetical protein
VKKLAIGCGLVLLLTGIAAAGVAYYLFRQVSSTVTQFAQFTRLPELERGVRNRAPFDPPSSQELTELQIEKLVQVQAQVRARLGERVAALEAKYKTLAEKERASLGDAPAILQAYSDLAATWMDAKRTQIEALNAAGLSMEEYRWIRNQAYRALGMPFVDLDISRLVEDAQRGVSREAARTMGAIGPDSPEVNRKRIEKVKKFLEENLALASFGL